MEVCGKGLENNGHSQFSAFQIHMNTSSKQQFEECRERHLSGRISVAAVLSMCMPRELCRVLAPRIIIHSHLFVRQVKIIF